jgi:hypothetical protein
VAVPVDLHEGFLGQFTGILRMAEVVEGKSEEAALILADEGFPGEFVARPHPLQQRLWFHV